jgi:GH15 family glucan-1,4-alpha-glucosidase
MEIGKSLQGYLPIEDHGIIGDLHTVALVGKNGRIDWCCMPSFDSPSVFGEILDAEKGGFYSIAPKNLAKNQVKQYYLPETNILVTRFLSSDGVAEVTDFMPIQHSKIKTQRHRLMRGVRVVHGAVDIEMTCLPAFNYARDKHTVELSKGGALFRSKGFNLALTPSVPHEQTDSGGIHASFTLAQNERAHFLLESTGVKDYQISNRPSEEFDDGLDETNAYWRTWLQHCKYHGRWQENVYRSALTLKLLTYAPTGAIVAAPTTSLPEGIGGERNWDYRFTWLRDSAFTLHSLLSLGFYDEAEDFANWLTARINESGEGPLQPMYTIEGGHELPEITLDNLEGYKKSSPVRIGNGAYKQLQLDVYGELFDALYILFTDRRGVYQRGWEIIQRQMDWLVKNWQTPDEGIWEVRGGRRAFLHSRLMCWVAFDRIIRVAQTQGLPAPLEEWTKQRDAIYNEIVEKGWNEKKQAYVQYYGADAVDASALLLSLTRFLDGSDPKMVKTIERIEKELMNEPHLYRYSIDQAASDGLKGHEGTFSICTFWLVEALAGAGRLEEARRNLEEMFTYANHLGLYSEEVGETGEALGNFPQAFTHLALISACDALDKALNKTSRVT